MTVKELKEALNQYDENMLVCIWIDTLDDDGGGLVDLDCVDIEPVKDSEVLVVSSL